MSITAAGTTLRTAASAIALLFGLHSLVASSSPGGQTLSLMERIRPSATWAQVRLPEAQIAVLREAASRFKGPLRDRPPAGIPFLFVGGEGPAGLTAAEALARDMGVEVVRVDLKAVVSADLRETQRKLQQVFSAAESARAVLLFNERDAFSGGRTGVAESEDRYANSAVDYLLQRMEQYRGLSILASNHKDARRSRALRRITSVVYFSAN